MNVFLRKIASSLMALAVVCSTMSFTVSMHYCGNTLVETAVFNKAKGCGMDMKQPNKEGCAVSNKNCCNDKQLEVDGQSELQLQVDKISFEQKLFIASFVYTYTTLLEDLHNNVTSYATYKPPLVIRQLYKIDETYLI